MAAANTHPVKTNRLALSLPAGTRRLVETDTQEGTRMSSTMLGHAHTNLLDELKTALAEATAVFGRERQRKANAASRLHAGRITAEEFAELVAEADRTIGAAGDEVPTFPCRVVGASWCTLGDGHAYDGMSDVGTLTRSHRRVVFANETFELTIEAEERATVGGMEVERPGAWTVGELQHVDVETLADVAAALAEAATLLVRVDGGERSC